MNICQKKCRTGRHQHSNTYFLDIFKLINQLLADEVYGINPFLTIQFPWKPCVLAFMCMLLLYLPLSKILLPSK